ncbi:MAG TPA: pilus assembly protein TadG-related protein [Nocardioides sp.]|nr:pilus assembly protein TadG-related protein [Nocardioides sp.]
MAPRPTSGRRDERGATAVLFALLALVLLGVGAVAVDMGQVYAKRGSLQSTVDLAVLAAAAELDGTNTCTAEAVNAASAYLQDNWIDEANDPFVVNLGGSSGDGDGFIQCTGWKVKLWAPTARVDFGLAKALDPGNDGVDVPATAEASVMSARLHTMPYYATPSCSNGQQVLSTDSKGKSTPPPIPLTPSSLVTNPLVDVTALSVTASPINVAIPTLVITGTGFTLATKVGFTTASGDHFESPSAGSTMTVDSPTKITVTNVPTGVVNIDDNWYVRVFNANLWSANDGNATKGVQMLTIGDPKLYCLDSSQGNFGSLLIARQTGSGNPNETLSTNVALGIDHALGLFPGAPNAPNECAGLPGAITTAVDGQNCVATDTGLPANALEEGLLEGIAGNPGLLEAPPTSPCSRPNVNVAGRSINDDVLSCFFTNGTVRVGDVTKSTYSGGSVINEAIFNSPRFFWVPVINAPPSGKKDVSIQAFRPAFITDQPASATLNAPGSTLTSPNGLTLSGTKVRELRIAFLNSKALPESISAEGGEIAYLGFGPKVIVLTD